MSEVIALNKNWRAICEIKDPNFRLVVAIATDPDLLAGLQRGFPHLFTAVATPDQLRVPVSALKHRCRELSREVGEWGLEDYDSNTWWTLATKEFGIPTWKFSDIDPDVGKTIPVELYRQLIGQPFRCGITVEWRGQTWMVVYLCHGQEPNFKVGDPIPDSRGDLEFAIAPAQFIDLES